MQLPKGGGIGSYIWYERVRRAVTQQLRKDMDPTEKAVAFASVAIFPASAPSISSSNARIANIITNMFTVTLN